MKETINLIENLSVEEREEIFARSLEGAAYEAFVEGNRHFAMISTIRLNADELARDHQNANRILHQAHAVTAQSSAGHPHRMISYSIH